MSGATPQPPGFPPGWVLGLKGLGMALVLLIAGRVLVDFVAIIVDRRQVALLRRIVEAESYTRTEIDAVDRMQVLVGGVQLLTALAIVVLTFVWLHRAYVNAIRLGSALPHRPGWAIGAWFVPIMMLVRPKRIVDQAWQASDPHLPAGSIGAWTSARTSPLVTAWWTVFLFDAGLRLIFASAPRRSSARALLERTQIATWLEVLNIVAAVLFLFVVRGLTARQTERIAVLGA